MADVVPDSGPLTTAGAVKNYLGITTANDDPLIERLILSVSAWIKQFLNRDILVGNYSERVDGTGTYMLQLTQYPVQAITSLTIGPPNASSPLVLVENVNYVFSRSGTIRLLNPSWFPRGVANVAIEYRAGYTSVPGDIEQAAIETVAWRYKEKSRIAEATKSLGGSETISFQTTDVPADVKTSLANWRRVAPI